MNNSHNNFLQDDVVFASKMTEIIILIIKTFIYNIYFHYTTSFLFRSQFVPLIWDFYTDYYIRSLL